MTANTAPDDRRDSWREDAACLDHPAEWFTGPHEPGDTRRAIDVCTSCPVNREIDPDMGAGGTSVSDDVLMRIEKGKNTVLHNDLCKGCKVCEDTCPNGAMHVARRVEAIQMEERS